MPLARPQLCSLTIHVPSVALWRVPRPPTPRRATIPLPETTSSSLIGPISPNAPPVPSSSYWEPKTPSPNLAPISPYNPFLSPPASTLAFDWHILFPLASPLLPASPLSIFDHAVSPTMATFLFSCTPSPTKATFSHPETAASPVTPRFLFPRSPPCLPEQHSRRRPSVFEAGTTITQKKGSIVSLMADDHKSKMNNFKETASLRVYFCVAASKLRGMGMVGYVKSPKKDDVVAKGRKTRLAWKALRRQKNDEQGTEDPSTTSSKHLSLRAMLCN